MPNGQCRLDTKQQLDTPVARQRVRFPLVVCGSNLDVMNRSRGREGGLAQEQGAFRAEVAWIWPDSSRASPQLGGTGVPRGAIGIQSTGLDGIDWHCLVTVYSVSSFLGREQSKVEGVKSHHADRLS